MNEGGPISAIDDLTPQLHAAFEKHGAVLAYLYGSQARGNAGPFSDVDIAILFPGNMSKSARCDRLLAVAADLSQVFGRDDVNVLDLAEGTPLLNNNVRLRGRLLYSPDECARIEFETDTLRRFLDTEPLRRELNWHLVGRIRQGHFA